MNEHETIARLGRIPTGPALFAALAGIGPVARRETDEAGVREVLPDAGEQVLVAQAWQRAMAWADAQLNNAVLQIAGDRIGPDDEDWGREEVAAALNWSNIAASDRIDVARALNGRSFLTRRALEAGRITYRHAAEMVRALEPLDDDAAADVEGRLLGSARSKTPAQFARAARKEVAKADPRGADERHRKARKGRRVEFTPLPDGMAELRATLGADQAARARALLDQFAGRTREGTDTRTIDQRRADALVAMIQSGALFVGSMSAADGSPVAAGATGSAPATGTPATGTPATNGTPAASGTAGAGAGAAGATVARRRAAPPRIALTAPLSTVLGASDFPGELTGYGPVPAAVVRELAADGRWEKWSTDQRGVVTDLGQSTYRPSAALAALVRATYPRCVFPGCSQPSYRCDLDHNVRRIDGGPTSFANLVPLCRRHHRAKDEAGWDLVHDPVTHACTWTSPAGQTYTVDPPDQGDGAEALGAPADWTTPLVPEPARVGAHAGDGAGDGTDEPPPF